jgi:hypothetical protein
VKKIKEQSGFGWDDTLKIATAPDDVWERYIAVSDHYLRLTALIFGANDAGTQEGQNLEDETVPTLR